MKLGKFSTLTIVSNTRMVMKPHSVCAIRLMQDVCLASVFQSPVDTPPLGFGAGALVRLERVAVPITAAKGTTPTLGRLLSHLKQKKTV